MNILYINSNALSPLSGENIRANYLIDKLVKEGHRVDLVAPDSNISYEDDKVNFFPVSRINRFGKNKELQYLRFGLRCFALSNKLGRDYDVVYCCGLSGSLFASRFSRKYNLPVVCEFWETDFPELRSSKNPLVKLLLKLSRGFHRRVMLKADKVTLISREMHDYVYKNLRKDSIVAYDAADKRYFNEKVKKKHSGFTFSYHGGILKRDGVLNFLKACDRLAKEHDDFQVMIIGDGPALAECRYFVDENSQLRDKVKFTGWVNYKKIPEYLSMADVGVVPNLLSPINDLVIPRKVFEYMNCGIPMVVSDLKAVRELFDEDNCCFFVEPADISGFYDKLKFCMRNKEKLGEASHKLLKMSESLNLDSECNKLVKLVEGAAKK